VVTTNAFNRHDRCKKKGEEKEEREVRNGSENTIQQGVSLGPCK